MAVDTSVALKCRANSRFGSVSTITCFTLPPNGSGTLAPFTFARRGRTNCRPSSYRSLSLSPCPLNPSCTIGTDDASYLITNGGNDPGGSTLRIVCTTLVICACATAICTCGWKYTLITATPW